MLTALTARGALIASLLAAASIAAPIAAEWPNEPAGAVGSTPTTTPGPAPNQSQINATKSQIAGIESTLAKEEQESNALDNRYINAVQAVQDAQNAVAAIDSSITTTKQRVAVDKQRLSVDAVNAYIYNTPQTKFDSLFSTSASLGSARNQYVVQIVGNLDQDRNALETAEAHLSSERTKQVAAEAQAQAEATQVQQLAQANAAEAAQTKSTLSQVQGQLAQEVAQAAIEEAQAEAAAAAAAAKAAAQAQAQRDAAAAAAAAAIANAVGGSASGEQATLAANQASGSAGNTGNVQGTSSGDSAQAAAVQAAESQLGVPYVWGGDSPSTGFDCSGLVQWAWGQAGVSIPRTTESQWSALPHVSLSALEPGDLLYYYNLDGDDAVDHVVMFVGSGPYGTNTVIQAPFTGADVSYSPVYTQGLIGAARP